MGTVLVTILIGLIVAVIIGGLIIMLATRVVGGFMPRFSQACIAALISAIGAGVLNWVVGMALGATTTTSIVCLVLVFLLNSAVINAIVRRPGGAALGFGTACLISLVQIVIEIILAVVIGILFGAAFFSMLGTMH
jgi:hypothetical protein